MSMPQINSGTTKVGADLCSLEEFIQHHMADGAKRVVGIEKAVFRLTLLFFLYAHLPVCHLLRHLPVDEHPAFLPVFVPMGFQKENSYEYKNQRPKQSLGVIGKFCFASIDSYIMIDGAKVVEFFLLINAFQPITGGRTDECRDKIGE